MLRYALNSQTCSIDLERNFVPYIAQSTLKQTWLRFQSLWDLQPDALYTRLGDNMDAWIRCLDEIK